MDDGLAFCVDPRGRVELGDDGRPPQPHPNPEIFAPVDGHAAAIDGALRYGLRSLGSSDRMFDLTLGAESGGPERHGFDRHPFVRKPEPNAMRTMERFGDESERGPAFDGDPKLMRLTLVAAVHVQRGTRVDEPDALLPELAQHLFGELVQDRSQLHIS